MDFGKKKNCGGKKGLSRMSPSLLWKSTPPGPEQLELNRLFESGEISAKDSAMKVRLSYPIFRGFSPRVFGLHFRKTKALYGAQSKFFLNFGY